ncbi:MAG: BatD family protein [Bacteroidota bacterium]
MNVTRKIGLGFVFLLMMLSNSFAQEASISYGANEIGLNQYFTVTLKVQNDRLKQHSPFPEIEGFIKRGTSSSTSTNYINGRMSSTQSLTQNYQATEKGTFAIPSFSMKVNGKDVTASSTTVKVGEAVKRQTRRDPFQDFFGGSSRNTAPTEFVDVKADAFLALSLDKEEVYLGEGFTATLAFYVAEANRAEMRFYDLSNQITEILKLLKPSNCWEENFNIEQIAGEPVQLGNRPYTQYKIHQTAYYPLTTGEIDFSTVGLKMIKYNVAKNPSFFGRNRQEDYQTFYSKAKKVKVVELPPHPLKDQVAVGNYRLKEEISTKSLKTGESFTYQFAILGEGNVSGIEGPAIPENRVFDFYEPNVKQNVNRGNGKVRGTKAFEYYAIPKEPGNYDLGEYFNWIYFNPQREVYDTLRSEISLFVDGESRRNLEIASADLGDFYQKINNADNELISLAPATWINYLLNGLLVILFGLTFFYLFKKPTS